MSTPDHPLPHPDVAGYVLGVLEPDESSAFAAHLLTCSDCQQEVAELGPLRGMLDAVRLPPTVPPGLAERTFAAVEREASTGPPRRHRTPRSTRRRLAGAAVAALAGAGVLSAVLVAWRHDNGGREVALIAPDGETRAVATLRRDSAGVAVELDVRGLEPPPTGSHYECWYVSDDDSVSRPGRVSAGTFTVKAPGTTKVRMITAADPRRYPRIEVTLEPDDGDPARTGDVVLRSRPRPPSAAS